MDPFKDEHDQILATLAELRPGRNSQVVLSHIIDHLGSHFLGEQRMMRRLRYPGMNDHMEEHTQIQDLFIFLLPKAINGSITQEEIELLQDRISHHIGVTDAAMMRFLNRYRLEDLYATAEDAGRS